MKKHLLILTFILLIITGTSFAQFYPVPAPADQTVLQQAQNTYTTPDLLNIVVINKDTDGFSGESYIVASDTTFIGTDSTGAGFIYNESQTYIYNRVDVKDTLWQDYSASSFFPTNDTLFTVVNDSVSTTDDAAKFRAAFDVLPGSVLAQFRIVMRGSNASQGWILKLWKKAAGATTYVATQIGATQTLVNNGKTVATYNFTNEDMVEGSSYLIQLESEAPSGTATLFSVGVQTIKRGL